MKIGNKNRNQTSFNVILIMLNIKYATTGKCDANI